MKAIFCLVLALLVRPVVAAPVASDYRADALSIAALVDANYAYRDRLADGRYSLTPKLAREATAVRNRATLISFAERALLLLADHHAITGASRDDSWAIVPSYADMWIERQNSRYVVTAVRKDSPAATSGVRAGDRLIAISKVPIDEAVTSFWNELGADFRDDASASFAARIVAAGRRNEGRMLTLKTFNGAVRTISVANLYDKITPRPKITSEIDRGALKIVFNNSLGENATIAAFDAGMAKATPGQPIIIDLTGTPGGGNSTVARAIMGWFVGKPVAYQIHRSSREERDTGIPRQWIEQVLPRPGITRHSGPVTIVVGRWTGSMGEGLAIGFDALGAKVVGDQMAGLLGAVEDFTLPKSGLILKLPVECVYTVGYVPREKFLPSSLSLKDQ